MEYTLKNQAMTLRVSGTGGEMQSILGADGTEYLWQGDPTYWKGRAPHLFPFIGRLTDGRYTMDGEEYSLGIHGFFRHAPLEVTCREDARLTLTLTDNEDTWAMYPCAFRASVTYSLDGDTIHVVFRVENTGDKAMHFAYGGHPGFNVPLAAGCAFEDYYLEFNEECQPLSVGLSPTCFIQGPDTPFGLEDGRRISLRHNLFDGDAIILRDMAEEISILSKKDGHGVTVRYPQMKYLGLWHMPLTEAPYVCIEPWSALPARQDVIEPFEEKPDMTHLPAGAAYENHWSITIHK